LAEASWHGRLEITRILLEYGANVNCIDKDRRTPLHKAAQKGHREVVILLVDYGKANIKAVKKDVWTPLHEASFYGHLLVGEALLERGARKTVSSRRGELPIDLARKAHRSEMVSLLR
jgi:ankyrin repeat protein